MKLKNLIPSQDIVFVICIIAAVVLTIYCLHKDFKANYRIQKISREMTNVKTEIILAGDNYSQNSTLQIKIMGRNGEILKVYKPVFIQGVIRVGGVEISVEGNK